MDFQADQLIAFLPSMNGLRQFHDVIGCILQRDELASAGQRDRFVERSFPAAISRQAATRSSLSGKERCNAFASSHGARIQTSLSSTVVRITGIAFGWIGSTTAFGAVVRKPWTRCGPGMGFDLVPRSPLNSVQIPANAVSGRSSLAANQTTSFFLVSGLAPARIRQSY
jgi:hypothetical protein